MGRTATGYVFSDPPDANTCDNFRADLNTNLSYWTVGSVYKFGSGTNERGYFTLTHNTTGAEILFWFAIGQWSYFYSGIHEDYRNSLHGNPNFSGSMQFSPEGGFEAALVAAHDPATTAYWDHITDTLGFAPPSDAQLFRATAWSGASCDWTYIEDDASDMFCVYHWLTAGINGNYGSCNIVGSTLLLQTKSDATYNTWIHINWQYVWNGSTPRDNEYTHVYVWSGEGIKKWGNRDYLGYYGATAYSAIGTLSSFTTGKAQFTYMVLRGNYDTSNSYGDHGEHAGHIDPDVCLIMPRVNNQVTAFGATTSKKYIQILDGRVTPWTNTLANPTF